VGTATITEMMTAFPGWDSVTNESDWITTEGRDEEADGRVLVSGEAITATTGLRRRIGLKWQSGNLCNWAAYLLWAYTGGAVEARTEQLRGAGTVDLFIMGPTGSPTATLLAGVEAILDDAETGPPATDDWAVYGPQEVEIDWEFTLNMLPGKAGDEDGIKATANSILNALHNPSAPVAGVDHLRLGEDVVLQKTFAALKVGGLGDLKSVTFTSPSADVTVAKNQLAVMGATPVITVSEASED
ncbi:MAG: baseplate J/gp47 family protein, partial [Deltaproteobacteria bacterium]|nr:baseplate J/gp47 family protein [Deltaproteobacteria bacterium]